VATSKSGGYATSTKNIVGCVLAIGGPVLAVVGVVAPPVGLALIPALYGIGALLAPKRKPVNVVAGITPGDVEHSLADIQRTISGKVPPDIGYKVANIAQTITETLPRADALGAGSPGQFTLVQCATNYLPTTLQAYLNLPRKYADEHIVSDGKTARDMLSAQLDLLSKQIDELSDAVNGADTDKLAANGRFLAEKFGTGPLDLSNPPPAPSPPPPPAVPPPPDPPKPTT
jgi:hypothetical protein